MIMDACFSFPLRMASKKQQSVCTVNLIFHF